MFCSNSGGNSTLWFLTRGCPGRRSRGAAKERAHLGHLGSPLRIPAYLAPGLPCRFHATCEGRHREPHDIGRH
jgi:hypothetical protein